MAKNSPLDVSAWYRKLGLNFKDSIAPYGLFCIFPYHQIKVDEPFLCATANYWVPSQHVFRFNEIELCPIVEEFGDIMGELGISSRCDLNPDLCPPHSTNTYTCGMTIALRVYSARPKFILKFVFG